MSAVKSTVERTSSPFLQHEVFLASSPTEHGHAKYTKGVHMLAPTYTCTYAYAYTSWADTLPFQIRSVNGMAWQRSLGVIHDPPLQTYTMPSRDGANPTRFDHGVFPNKRACLLRRLSFRSCNGCMACAYFVTHSFAHLRASDLLCSHPQCPTKPRPLSQDFPLRLSRKTLSQRHWLVADE